MKNPDISFKDYNPLCGDIIKIDMNIQDNNICDICFSGSGCVISQVCADLLLNNLKNKNIKDVKNIDKNEMLKLINVELSPLRMKCALLSLKVLKMCIYNYLGEKLEVNKYD